MIDDGIECKLSWIHTLLYDALEHVPTEEGKLEIAKAIEHIEECENQMEIYKTEKE